MSLEAQKDAIEAFASQNNLTVTKWFEEKETAAKSGRPIFNAMLKQLKHGAASGLIMHKIDRSARNLRDWAIVSELPDAGVDVYIATESLDFNSRGGRLTADIQAVIAADYIRNLREECIKGLNGRLKQGLYPFRAPIGYLDNGRGQPKTICPVKGPLVHDTIQLYASGRFSIRSLMNEAERRGLRNHAGKPLSQHGIETILANPFYTGLIVIKRTGATFQGVHKPLVEMKTFQRVQDIKAGKAGKKVTRHNHQYRGLFRCGLCDGPMSPERQKGWVYYRCQKPECATKTVREDAIDQAVQAALGLLELCEAQAEKLRNDWLAWIESNQRETHIRSIELRLDHTRERLSRLTDLLIDGTIGKADFNDRKRTLALELAQLEENRKDADRNHLSIEQMEIFIELMKNLSRLHISAEPAEKRSLVKNCFSNRTVVGKEPCLKPHSWLQSQEFSELSPLVNHIDPLIELFCKSRKPAGPKTEPQWKKNLKYQHPTDGRLNDTV
ncbi:recombinase family protein [Pseudohalocynthiibacter sp. F2068]|nr:recombinase family protein [Pseudohalocynthiibacter sp. F2068]